MANITKVDEFPKDNNLWRIDIIDFISYSTDDEIRVRVYLSRLRSEIKENEALHNKSLYKDKDNKLCSTEIEIRVGAIHHLKIGTIWLNGVLQPSYRGFETSISISSEDLIKLVPLSAEGKSTYLNDNNIWEDIWSDSYYRIAHETAKKRLWVTVILSDSDYKRIIIPSSVIFQNFYIPSHKAASHILYGKLDKIINLNKSGFLVDDHNTFRIHLRHDYKDHHAPLLANLITNSSAKDGLKILRKHIQLHKLKKEESNPKIPLKVSFPFSDDVKIKAIGKTFYFEQVNEETNEIEEVKGFFVTEIKSLNTALSFKKLIINRDNNNDKAENKDEDLPPAYSGGKPQSTSNIEPSITLDIANAPSSNLEGSKIDEDNCLIVVDDLEILPRDDKEYQVSMSKPFHAINDLDSNDGTKFGVGDINSGGKNPPVDTEDTEAIPPVSYNDFIEIITKIKEKKVKIKTLPIQNFQVVNNYFINRFNKKIPRMRSWHKIDDRTRTYIIVEIYSKGVFSYLVYIEAKGQDALSCCVIRSVFGTKINNVDFGKFIIRVAQSNGWSVFERYPELFMNWKHEHVKYDRDNNSKTVDKIMLLI